MSALDRLGTTGDPIWLGNDHEVCIMTTDRDNSSWDSFFIRRYADGGDVHTPLPFVGTGIYVSVFSPFIPWSDADDD